MSGWIITAIAVIVVVVLLAKTFFTVKQQTEVLVERFGKFARAAGPGLHVKIPFVEHVAGQVSYRVDDIPVKMQTKTKDNVFVDVSLSIQYRAVEGHAREAWYGLDDPVKQITQYVYDAVRAFIPTQNLDDTFDHKDELADQVDRSLSATMAAYGWSIERVLVTDIDPDAKVKQAMNSIQVAQRDQIAATAQGEANKIRVTKEAEAQAEAARLAGKGIADQRIEITKGLTASILQVKDATDGHVDETSILSLQVLTQYTEMMERIGQAASNSTIFLPGSPDGAGQLQQAIRDAMLTSFAAQNTRPDQK